MREDSKPNFTTVLLQFCSNLALLTAVECSGELGSEYKQTYIYNDGWHVWQAAHVARNHQGLLRPGAGLVAGG